ncbi:MAG: S4 domain-containing protein [Flavobacteriales bacterium]
MATGALQHHRVVCDPNRSLVRLDKFLFDRLANTSRSRVQAAAKEGHVRVNGKAEKPSYKVKPGDVIRRGASLPPAGSGTVAGGYPPHHPA